MQKFKVTGMSCAACSARVEKAVSGAEGVTECNVNLLTGDMTVNDDADRDIVIKAVIDAGYGVESGDSPKIQEKEIGNKKIVFRLVSSCVLLLVLMYFSMFHTMWGAPLPTVIADNFLAQAMIQLLLTSAVMIINGKFFTSGFKAIINLAPNMDTLVALGSAAAYGYSVANVFMMTSANAEHAQHLLHGLYFESAAMILTLITVGKLLEAHAKGKTTNAIKALLELAPKTVTVIKDGREITVDVTAVLKGDIFVVLPGQSFAVDGVVTEGESSVDESSITGESLPIDKVVGSSVTSGTINKTGRLVCRATAVGEESTLAKIVKMVSDAASSKAPIARIADKVSAVFVPAVLVIALITFVTWSLLDKSVGFALSRAITVLVISCPCALGLATPVAIMVGSGVGARKGILFKNAQSLEMSGKCNVVALDKTGTITEGKPSVTDVLPLNKTQENRLLQIAYTIENGSAHPLAIAIKDYAIKNNITALGISQFAENAGFGVSGIIDGKTCVGCSVSAAKENGIDILSITPTIEKIASEGKTPLLFIEENILLGVIAVADTIKSDTKAAISEFKKLGITPVMITGDNPVTASAVAKKIGIDNVKAGVKPDGKAQIINELKENGKVIMIGDGINDAPALTTADIGVAIGSGMDVAIESADIVLTGSKLSDAVSAVRLSRKTLTNIKQNLFWAFAYNVVGIPLAAGVFGLELNPMFGATAMSLSSFCVVINALRLNFFKTKSRTKKEKKTMKKTITIQGLMCPHCEAHTKSALEKISGVTVFDISHKTGIANVQCDVDVSDETLKNTIESQGYKVVNID